MSWPITLGKDLHVTEMAFGARGVHVRKHLLALSERWDQVADVSRHEIAMARRHLQVLGLVVGPEAAPTETSPKASRAITDELYRRAYRPVARAGVLAALDGEGLMMTFGEYAAVPALYILTLDHVVIVCSGARRLRWRTAYRLRSAHRPTASLKRIHSQHVRSVRRAASHLGGQERKEESSL